MHYLTYVVSFTDTSSESKQEASKDSTEEEDISEDSFNILKGKQENFFTDNMKNLSVSTPTKKSSKETATFAMKVSTRMVFPYVQFCYTENYKNYICVEYFVFSLSPHHYWPSVVSPSCLGLKSIAPTVFYNKNRQSEHLESIDVDKNVSYHQSVKQLHDGKGQEQEIKT